MSTKHSKAAEKFLQDSKMAAWHNETLWMVRAKRDKMSKEVPEWEELRNKACELKLYSNSHLEELLLEFEKNATANGAIVHWAKDADEYCAIVYEILNEHNVHHFIKSKSMLAEGAARPACFSARRSRWRRGTDRRAGRRLLPETGPARRGACQHRRFLALSSAASVKKARTARTVSGSALMGMTTANGSLSQ